MKNQLYIFIFYLLLSIFFACSPKTDEQNTSEETQQLTSTPEGEPQVENLEKTGEATEEITPSTGALIFLQAYEGKHLHEVDLFAHPSLQPRFAKLLGDDFTLLETNIQVSSPMKLDMGNNVLFASGIAPRSGGLHEAALAIDIQNDAIFVVIMQEQKLRTYQENSQLPLPSMLAEWKQDQIQFDGASE